MKNVLNIKMKIWYTHYLLQIKITEYIFEINSSNISESSCPLENVTNPHTITIDVSCTSVQYIDLRILLPCYCQLIHLWLHFITKSSLFSTAQYQDHLFGCIKHSSNSFWLFCNKSLTGDSHLEQRNLQKQRTKMCLGAAGNWCLWSTSLGFPPLAPFLCPSVPCLSPSWQSHQEWNSAFRPSPDRWWLYMLVLGG